MWKDALNGKFQDRVRLLDNKLVRNGRWRVPTPLVHRLVAECHDAIHLTTSSVEKHWNEINHGVEGEGLYKPVELQCQTCPSCAIYMHDTKRKQGYMTPMPIPMEPMDSIALDVFQYPSTSHDGEEYDVMLLCVCRLSSYLTAIPIRKPCNEDPDEGLTGKRATHWVMEHWVNRFRAPREICSNCGSQFVSQYFQTPCSKTGARSTMCLAGRRQGNGIAPLCTDPSGYTPNESVFGTHNRTKRPPLAEPKAVPQDAMHYFQRRDELLALAGRAIMHVQGTMAHKYDKGRRMFPNFS